ncbi:hypothetical protein AGOR_G00195480 [Albula goreensis]|uniref:AAA+ ATPase domain-containing protein n=1 Tax=Albula goreensis TaxID=1534307 RepID=A0A8T3CRW8_9TELE|nr:hypothetical protein AGOR_G00195480 [Albula goreensis]
MKLLWETILLYTLTSLAVATEIGHTEISVLVVVSAITLTFNLYKTEHFDCLVVYNSSGLEYDLRKRVFGQHAATDIVLRAVSQFMADPEPPKPLVLSFHGPTGTGKSLVAQLIARNIYEQGDRSSHVHALNPTQHFPLNTQVEAYKVQLQQWIRGNVSACPRSMFIFDEIDLMNPVLTDTVLSLLDHYTHAEGACHRRAIFIFLSTVGGEALVQQTLALVKEGRDRREFSLSVHEWASNIFQSVSGVPWPPRGMKWSQVDFFVPFLPLESKHVLMCTLAEMQARGLVPDMAAADELISDMPYAPQDGKFFSACGCKNVALRLSTGGRHAEPQQGSPTHST